MNGRVSITILKIMRLTVTAIVMCNVGNSQKISATPPEIIDSFEMVYYRVDVGDFESR